MKKVAYFILLTIVLNACKAEIIRQPKIIFEKDKKIVAVEINKDEDIFTNLDSKTILPRLYDSKIMDTTGILWKPNYSERNSTIISYDGYCHTSIDTIMYFEDQDNANCAVVIFDNYEYLIDYPDSTGIHIGGSHFSSLSLGLAVFKKTKENQWENYGFKKHFASLGYFGEYKTRGVDQGKICLKKIADNYTCLSLVQGLGGTTGFFWGYEMLFNIEPFQLAKPTRNDDEVEGFNEGPEEYLFQQILTYNYYCSYCFLDNPCNIKEIKLQFIKGKKDYYDLNLIITKNGKKSVEKYYYNRDICKYVKK